MNEKSEIGIPNLSPYDPDPKVLYTFCKLEYLEKTVKGELRFAATRTYNDIHENTIFARPADIGGYTTFSGEKRMKDWLDSHVVKCFSKDPTNTLMWAHYADNHRGVCVGFHFETLKETIVGDQPLRNYPIRYSSTPPLTLISEEISDTTVGLLAFDVLHTKSIHWSYEQEHRFYTLRPDLAAEGAGFVDVGPDAVVEVIYGANVEGKTVEENRKTLPDHVKVSVAEIDSRALSYNMVLRALQD